MGTKEFLSKGWPTRFGFFLSKHSPPWLGYRLVGLFARTMYILKPDVYYAAYQNLKHVLGPETPEPVLRRTVYRLFYNALKAYYELFRNVGRGRVKVETLTPPVKFRPEVHEYIQQGLDSGRGLFILGCHMSNFDLAGIGMSQYIPVPVQALSLSSPPPGFEFFNRLREKGHGIITPISPAALRDAMARLKSGGIVLTGVDRPIGLGDEPVEFFGATAYLPCGYIRIPLKVDCLVMTVGFVYEDGIYWVEGNPPMEMVRTGDRRKDVEVNLRRVLSQIEAFIRRAPDQWMMFLPVWREGPDLPMAGFGTRPTAGKPESGDLSDDAPQGTGV